MTSATVGGRPQILHVVTDLNSGGLEKNLLLMVQRTADRFVHHVCCIRQRGELAHRFEACAANVTALDITGRSLSVAFRLAEHCRRVAPQVVHTRNWGAIDGIVGARLAGVPAIVHGEHGRDHATWPRRRGWTLRALSTWTDAIVGVSDDLGNYLRSEVGVGDSKVVVIPNGVDAERFRPAPERDRLRHQLGLEPGSPTIIAVGRLYPIKNYTSLVASFAAVRQGHPTARMVIVGDGPDREQIEKAVAQRGLQAVVRLVGYRDDIENWFAAADVFAHTAAFEGMNNAALEAMATALPVVATSVGGLREIVADGVTGRLVPYADENAMTQALLDYCLDARLRMRHGDAGRRRVMSKFTAEAMVGAYAQLYERLTGYGVAVREAAPAP